MKENRDCTSENEEKQLEDSINFFFKYGGSQLQRSRTLHRPDMPSNRGAILRRLIEKKRSCVPEKKAIAHEKKLYFHTLYLNTLF